MKSMKYSGHICSRIREIFLFVAKTPRTWRYLIFTRKEMGKSFYIEKTELFRYFIDRHLGFGQQFTSCTSRKLGDPCFRRETCNGYDSRAQVSLADTHARGIDRKRNISQSFDETGKKIDKIIWRWNITEFIQPQARRNLGFGKFFRAIGKPYVRRCNFSIGILHLLFLLDNYSVKYSRFILNDQIICILLGSGTKFYRITWPVYEFFMRSNKILRILFDRFMRGYQILRSLFVRYMCIGQILRHKFDYNIYNSQINPYGFDRIMHDNQKLSGGFDHFTCNRQKKHWKIWLFRHNNNISQ